MGHTLISTGETLPYAECCPISGNATVRWVHSPRTGMPNTAMTQRCCCILPTATCL